MTYQEILEEFATRRANPPMFINPITNKESPDYQGQILNLQWAIQSILEKLRDKE
jgi:hypothetical protein